jgi:uncharacterized glyoxalase superfamily protein PhnB/uncharacterized protein YndB with AHSA1/START domain
MKMDTSIEIDADPETTFRAFTDEMDQWWGNGPIDSWDYSRKLSRRIEPGVGGRVLEVYPDDELELARITRWEPGRRLSWQSSLDDVAIDVVFEPVGTRTLVRVTGEVPEGGTGGAGFSFVRMTPQWLGRYFARGRRPWLVPDRLMPVIHYERPAVTARWLCDAFGFQSTADISDDGGHGWIELRLGTSTVVVQGDREPNGGRGSHEILLFVDDLQDHFASAERAGATIVQPIKTHGFTAYVADDPEGCRWQFAQANTRQG